LKKQRKIIGLTGYHRAGKDVVSDYLKENYGFKTLTFSDALKKRLEEKGKKVTKNNLSKEGDELRKEKGRGGLAKELYNIIENKEWEKVVMNGFLSPEEVEYIQEKPCEFHLIEIRAEPEIRFQRRSEDEPDEKEEFLKRDKRDIEKKGADEAIKMAEYILENNSDLESLYKKIDRLMEKLSIEETN